MARYFLKNGSPVESWSEIPPEDLNTNVDESIINNSVVTTVFTGFNLGTEDDPKIFETTIQGGYYDGCSERYFTEEAALKGHALWVKKISEPVDPNVELLANIILNSSSTNPYRIAEYIISKVSIKF